MTKLGIVADADRTSGGGVQARWDTLTAALAAFGYNTPAALPELPNMGTVLGNRDGLPPVGLWLMPNHQGDGNLEDFILLSVIGDCTQTDLLDYAQDVTARLPHTLFVYLIPYSRGITTQKPWFIHGWHGSKGQVWV
ncbi:MAG: hypothetical protein GKR94_28195 [Gammaproteobacteria bacterium]|nr:hypothetical protein [Gammaproteobacteria bacterium]